MNDISQPTEKVFNFWGVSCSTIRVGYANHHFRHCYRLAFLLDVLWIRATVFEGARTHTLSLSFIYSLNFLIFKMRKLYFFKTFLKSFKKSDYTFLKFNILFRTHPSTTFTERLMNFLFLCNYFVILLRIFYGPLVYCTLNILISCSFNSFNKYFMYSP